MLDFHPLDDQLYIIPQYSLKKATYFYYILIKEINKTLALLYSRHSFTL